MSDRSGRPERDPPAGLERELSGWGRHPRVRGRELRSEDLGAITRDAILCRGLGRAYGDAALPPPGGERPLAGTRLADRLLAFGPDTGVLRAEAGLSLRALNEVFLPRNWCSPVSPGTQSVTLGGMVAADVHGKNHHVAGTLGRHVRSLRMRVADGRVLEVNRESEPELFAATLGGMGLTGHILEVELALERIPSPWILRESERCSDLEATLQALHTRSGAWPMTVAWVDASARGEGLGRGVVLSGRWADAQAAPEHAPPQPAALRVPLAFPNGVFNTVSARALNALWFRKPLGGGVRAPFGFLYPLDGWASWNRAYGPSGFTQYQCVLPSDPGAVRGFLELFQSLGLASFVSVLKDCGPAGEGHLSFPQPGTSIALDFPVRGDSTRACVESLNAHVLDHGGRIYLAKDAFTRAEDFRAMYPRLQEWLAIRRAWDPDGHIRSAQSARLLPEEA